MAAKLGMQPHRSFCRSRCGEGVGRGGGRGVVGARRSVKRSAAMGKQLEISLPMPSLPNMESAWERSSLMNSAGFLLTYRAAVHFTEAVWEKILPAEKAADDYIGLAIERDFRFNEELKFWRDLISAHLSLVRLFHLFYLWGSTWILGFTRLLIQNLIPPNETPEKICWALCSNKTFGF